MPDNPENARPANDKAAARAARLAAELRENLKKRKARARAVTSRQPEAPEASDAVVDRPGSTSRTPVR